MSQAHKAMTKTSMQPKSTAHIHIFYEVEEEAANYHNLAYSYTIDLSNQDLVDLSIRAHQPHVVVKQLVGHGLDTGCEPAPSGSMRSGDLAWLRTKHADNGKCYAHVEKT